ncbi:hypothetical protein B0H16DRAFT_1780881 [Mycena metata]|uniref:Peptidase S53 activation domain-containing protein n=1 Tax=Mycena metata TaxID=1033252 RepID=A0AAD7NNW3_9AGAR|nr:hypothetical protein B0H16DRAFT_1780881 [Mycena metata]
MLKALSLLLLVGTTRGEFTVLERRDSPPSGFSRVGPSPPDTVLNLRLALTQNNISGLHDTVYEVSTPGNSRYGQYLSKEEVMFALGTLAPSNSLSGQRAARRRLLNLPEHRVESDIHRTLSYSIPAALRTGINMVYPTVTFPAVKPPSTIKTKLSTVSNRNNWTPTCIQALYGVPSTPATPAANTFGVCGFNNEFADEKDLTAFLETYRPDIASNTTFSLISIDDGINNQLPSGTEENP